jgi:uncharacterized protein (DUF849 family)
MVEGVLQGPGLFSLVLGIKYGFPASAEAMIYARNMLPAGAKWTGFAISRMEFPAVALSYVLGGHVRVGLEDNIFLEKGKLAPSNAALVQRAREIIERLGGTISTAAETRKTLGLPENARAPQALASG